MRTPQIDRLLSAEDAAELLGVRPSTIRWWWTIGKLHRIKIGRLTRVHLSEILRLIPEETSPAKPAARQKGAVPLTAPPPLKEEK